MRNIREALFTALSQGDMTASELSRISGVREAAISGFRNGRNLSSENLQKLIDALPGPIYLEFHLLLSERKMSRSQIAECIAVLARKLAEVERQQESEQEENLKLSLV